jgi:hypothetical protein
MSSVEVNAVPRENGLTLNERATYTVFTRGKEGDSPQPSPEKVRQKTSRVQPAPFPKNGYSGTTWLVRAKENITMATRCRQLGR